jgi:carbon storage regulator CsrA
VLHAEKEFQMLVLSRKNRESVVIGGTDGLHRLCRVTVLDIRGTNVKLGFEVDPDVPVHRTEVWERIRTGGPPSAVTAEQIAKE